MNNQRNYIAIISLSLVGLALLLAVLPPYIIENEINELQPKYTEPLKTYTVETKGVKLGFGKRNKIENQVDNTEKIENLQN